jgi:ABC-2 type transport system ATP-binding protein
MSDEPLAVRVRGLVKSYGSVQAVGGVSFTVQKGEVFALLGPNGAGKTTTIEILEGFRSADSGAIQVLGVDPGNRRTQRWLRTRMGIVLQELAVEPFLSVRQVLTRNAGFYPNPRAVEEVLDLVGLSGKAGSKVKTLSGGQQRRLDVGLGIVGQPELLFLDEPTTGLDPGGRRATWELIRQLGSEGTTVILTSHYMDEVEALASRVAVMSGGHIVASGTPDSIGGRDAGVVTIRFRLPTDVPPESLPVPGQQVIGGEIEVRTEDELPVLHKLTGWALDQMSPCPG